MTPWAVEPLATSLPQLLAGSLESLSLTGIFSLQEIEKKGASILGKKQPDLVADCLVHLLSKLSHLQKLELEHCHIQDLYMARIISALARSSPHCRTLNLRGNMCDTESFMILHSWLVKSYCAIEHLDLSWQRESRKSERNCGVFYTLPVLVNAISKNTSLKTLLLSENKFRDDEICSLSQALQVNTTLRNLELKDCHITTDGMIILAEHMKHFHLKRLNLNGQQRVEHFKALKSIFFTPLCNNHYLYDLVLPNHQTEESKSLSWLLEWNQAGRRVLADDKFPEHLWPIVLSRADRICRQGQTQPICGSPVGRSVSGDAGPLSPASSSFSPPASPTRNLLSHRPGRISRSPSPVHNLVQEQEEQKKKKQEERATRHGASIIFHLLSEKGYHSVLTTTPSSV